MTWNRSNTIGLAQMRCVHCHGFGMRSSQKRGTVLPCNCVFRSIFRICYRRFRECVQMEKRISTVTLDWSSSSTGKRSYGRKIEEYIADFCNIARRILDDEHYQIFRYHFILGADWTLCCRRLNLQKGLFYRRVYRIMALLGREFAEVVPYHLYPVDEYFGTVVARSAPAEVKSIAPRRGRQRPKTPEDGLLKIA
jgi:hypothetical protein